MVQSLYRLTSEDLIQTMHNWESLIKFSVNLIAYGGTALTLLGIKESTKDIDFLVPIDAEYRRLMKFLESLGYRESEAGLFNPSDPYFLYQFWRGNWVFTTELLDSPLEPGKNIMIKKWRNFYLGALNLTDLIITKIFRGTSVDVDDCVAVFATGQVDHERLLERYAEAALYDIKPDAMMKNFIIFVETLHAKSLVTDSFLDKVRTQI